MSSDGNSGRTHLDGAAGIKRNEMMPSYKMIYDGEGTMQIAKRADSVDELKNGSEEEVEQVEGEERNVQRSRASAVLALESIHPS